MLELRLLIPDYETEENSASVLLKDVEKKLGIKTRVERFTREEGWEIKMRTMLPVSVSKKIRIKQTGRTKSLYPQLLVYLDGRLFTFYPQRYGQKEITIREFLSGLRARRIFCLHDKKELLEAIAKHEEPENT